MSTSPSPLPLSAVVTRLRAAGCVFAEDEAELILSTAASPADLTAMVSMGPSAHHITPQALAARIRSLPSRFTVTIDLRIRVFQRPGDRSRRDEGD